MTTTKTASFLEPISEVFHFDGLDLFLIEGNIVVSRYQPGAFLDIELAKNVQEKIGVLTQGKAYPNLFIACPDLNVSKEVTEWGSKEIAYPYTTKSAIVCNTLTHRIMGNFLIKVKKPPRPTKMFASVEKAIIWLRY